LKNQNPNMDMKEMVVVDMGESGHELTQDVNNIRNVRTSDGKIDKTIHEVVVESGIVKEEHCGTKTSVKLHRSVHRAMISKARMIKKIMNAFSLREVVAVRCGCDLKKVAKRTQVRHVQLITKMNLNKSNILRIIPHDEHIIYIGKNQCMTTGKCEQKEQDCIDSQQNQEQ
jgi:hypothetical protein